MAKVKVKRAEDRLAEMSRNVAKRLSHPSRARTVKGNGLNLYTVQDFLSRDECAQLIAMINIDRHRSELLIDHPDKEYRTSDSCNLNPHDPFIEGIEDRICHLLGLNPRYGETMQGQVYEVGQQFKPHYDWFHKGSPYWDNMQQQGGQRSWTAMIYLNEPAAGGETEFPVAELKVKPVTAMLVAWNNMGDDGLPSKANIHAGTPVLAGTKYIITKWFRERFWR